MVEMLLVEDNLGDDRPMIVYGVERRDFLATVMI